MLNTYYQLLGRFTGSNALRIRADTVHRASLARLLPLRGAVADRIT